MHNRRLGWANRVMTRPGRQWRVEEVGVGPAPAALAGRPAARPGSARRGGPAQRRRPVPLLAPRGDPRRPGGAASPVPRRHRELAARLEHRHGRPQRQRLHGRRRCTSSATGAGTAAARWSPTATSTSGITRRRGAGRLGGGRTLPLIGIDLLPGSASIVDADLPERCVLLFGQEGPGLRRGAGRGRAWSCTSPQDGSTRSINAGVARGSRCSSGSVATAGRTAIHGEGARLPRAASHRTRLAAAVHVAGRPSPAGDGEPRDPAAPRSPRRVRPGGPRHGRRGADRKRVRRAARPGCGSPRGTVGAHADGGVLRRPAGRARAEQQRAIRGSARDLRADRPFDAADHRRGAKHVGSPAGPQPRPAGVRSGGHRSGAGLHRGAGPGRGDRGHCRSLGCGRHCRCAGVRRGRRLRHRLALRCRRDHRAAEASKGAPRDGRPGLRGHRGVPDRLLRDDRDRDSGLRRRPAGLGPGRRRARGLERRIAGRWACGSARRRAP